MATQQKGFSLMEMMVVVTIIGILSAFAYTSYEKHQEKVMRSLAKSGLDSLSQQMQTYYLKSGKKVLTKAAYEDKKDANNFQNFSYLDQNNNNTKIYQSPENDANFSKYFKIEAIDINDNLFVTALPIATNKYKVGAYYSPKKIELKSCKTNNKSYSPTNWTECK